MKEQKNFLGEADKTKKICLCAAFAAAVCVCTFISVPLPIGYFNLGDIAVLMSAYVLGAGYGAIAAALGSALSDLLLGYVVYAPATAVIKGLVALSFCLLYSVLRGVVKKASLDTVSCVLAALISETLMVGGYFLYEAVVLSYGLGATASVLGNCLQGLCGAVGAVFIISAIKKLKSHGK